MGYYALRKNPDKYVQLQRTMTDDDDEDDTNEDDPNEKIIHL